MIIRTITHSEYISNTLELFTRLGILKLPDIIKYKYFYTLLKHFDMLLIILNSNLILKCSPYVMRFIKLCINQTLDISKLSLLQLVYGIFCWTVLKFWNLMLHLKCILNLFFQITYLSTSMDSIVCVYVKNYIHK